MSRRQVSAVIVLVAVFAWGVVMAAFGETAAVVAALGPSLVLVLERVGPALSGGRPQPAQAAGSCAVCAPAADADGERAG